ncbi:MAG: hypothetical protein KDF65_11140, partial [Anaerolineae bacterium]|nr:hypothetical protein [Anaerolineae bacterium]
TVVFGQLPAFQNDIVHKLPPQKLFPEWLFLAGICGLGDFLKYFIPKSPNPGRFSPFSKLLE